MKRMIALVFLVAACAGPMPVVETTRAMPTADLNAGETPRMRALIRKWAGIHGLPESLFHRVIQRESDYRAGARNGPYWGLMQILPQTARQMGHQGPPSSLLDPEVSLQYAGKYLKGAWMVSDGDEHAAMMWYAKGYYYEAKKRCLLRATGLNKRETARHCK